MNLYDLKIDKKLQHHYLLVIILNPLNSNNPGKLAIRCGPFYFNNDDVKRLRNTVILGSDKLFKTKMAEAASIYNVDELIHSIAGMQRICKTSEGTYHHFSSEYEIDKDFFHSLVDMANTKEYEKKILSESRIKNF